MCSGLRTCFTTPHPIQYELCCDNVEMVLCQVSLPYTMLVALNSLGSKFKELQSIMLIPMLDRLFVASNLSQFKAIDIGGCSVLIIMRKLD